MARIRYIKPDFYNHEELAKCSALARLVFLGLPCHADREGRLKDQPGRLRAMFFPYDASIDMNALLDELAATNVAVRYEVDGVRYLAIRGFLEHQKPHPREPDSVIPPPPIGASRGKPRPDSAGPETIPPSTGGMEGISKGREGNPLPAAVQKFPLRPLIAKRNLHAAYEHPRFDVPQWWHDEKVKGLAGGESRLLQFYRWLGDRVARTNEDTEPRKEWLNEAFKDWLAANKTTAAAASLEQSTHRHEEKLRRISNGDFTRG